MFRTWFSVTCNRSATSNSTARSAIRTPSSPVASVNTCGYRRAKPTASTIPAASRAARRCVSIRSASTSSNTPVTTSSGSVDGGGSSSSKSEPSEEFDITRH